MTSLLAAFASMGGIATYPQLRHAASRRAIERCLARGEITKERRGCYVLASTSEHPRTAHEMSAVLSHESAALYYGWKVKSAPTFPP